MIARIFVTTAGFALLASAALAAPTAETTPGRLQNSKHDLNKTYNSDAEKGEICIYCHTPHNAYVSPPLWNRHNPTNFAAFLLYNSPTLSPSTKQAVLQANSISLFCMSCHDGVTGLGDVQNKNVIGGATYQYGIQTSKGANDSIGVIPSNTVENARFGQSLTNTHPIGFDFNAIPGADSGIRDRNAIMVIFESKKATTATTPQEFLYGPGNNMFECASCHRVHDPGTSGNFLRIENDKSQLCLACHQK